MNQAAILVISPHLDDAALSCGGLIRRLTGSGRPVSVATVFTADAPDGQKLSWLAQRNQRAWDLPDQPFAIRCQEDLKALEQIGAEALHLGFLDIIYRLGLDGEPLYRKTVVGIPVHITDLELSLPRLQAKFREVAGQFADSELTVFSPLALGRHVDHKLVRQAIETVWTPMQIVYYEDFPYAGRSGVMQDWLAGEGADTSWKPLQVNLSEQEIAARVAAVACYRSQLRGLFPSRLERIEEITRARLSFLATLHFPRDPAATSGRMEAYIRNYIALAGGERYWLHGRPAVSLFDAPNAP